MVHEALAAAQVMGERGKEVEVVDLRSLLPYDREALLESTARCHRVLVLHEAQLTGGFGAEVAAFIAEHAFEALDAPVMRLAAPDVPVPFAASLEKAFLPTREKIEPALVSLLEY
jgi:pyruvate/2-oxoglutarate/acetoin dehydrogenase E1 component